MRGDDDSGGMSCSTQQLLSSDVGVKILAGDSRCPTSTWSLGIEGRGMGARLPGEVLNEVGAVSPPIVDLAGSWMRHCKMLSRGCAPGLLIPGGRSVAAKDRPILS